MSKVVTLQTTPTGTTLRWLTEGQVLHVAGPLPAVWLQILRDNGYTIHVAPVRAA